MKQTHLNSFLEALLGASIAAPSALMLHKFTLITAGENALNGNQDIYITLTWWAFFAHSIAWKHIIRRVLVHYDAENLTIFFKKVVLKRHG